MADGATTPSAVTIDNPDQTRAITWSCTGNATGSSCAFGQWPDRTISVQGTWGSATFVLQGSNDGGTTWFTLTDHLGNSISWTANTMALVAENPGLVRATTSGGTSTSVTVYMYGSRA
jgi:hypothetical protein